FFQAEDGIRDLTVTGVQTCALPIFSDRTEPLAATLRVRLLDFEGKSLAEITKPFEVSPLTSKSYQSIPTSALVGVRDPSKIFLHCELIADGRVVSSNTLFFRPFKDLSLPVQIGRASCRER